MSIPSNHSSERRPGGRLVGVLILSALPLFAGEPGVPAGTDAVPQPPAPTAASGVTAGDRPLGSEGPVMVGAPLALDAAVRIAIAENPLLRAAAEGVAAAVEGIGIAKAAYFPDVTMESRYRRFDSHVFLPAGVPAETSTLGATDDWSAGLKIGYSLYDGGVRRAETEAAKAGLAAYREDAQRVRQDVVFGVHRAYYRVQSAEAERSAAVARIQRARDHLRLAQTLKDAGAVPLADVLRARVELAEAELGIVRAEGNVRTSYGDLNTAMGLPAALAVAVEGRSVSIPEGGDHRPEEALARALRQRPEIAAARERIAAAGKRMSAIAGSYGPHLRAEAAAGVRDSQFLPQDEDWSVGVALRVPIFSGFSKTHRVERARSEGRVLEAEAEALSNRIGQEVWAAVSGLKSAAEAVHQTAELRGEAEQSLAFARARYEAGAGTMNDLLDAEANLTRAEAAQVASELDHRLAAVVLLRAQGDL